MRSTTFLRALIAQAAALAAANNLEAYGSDEAQNAMDKLADNLIDRLIDKLIGRVMSRSVASLLPAYGLASAPSLASPLANYQPQLRSPTRGVSASAVASYQPQSLPQFGTVTSPVRTMQNTLRKYGVEPSPFENLALTSIVATRDVSMKAQINEAFRSMDANSQAKLAKLNQEVIVKASTIKAEDMVGINPPTGLFDPLGFSKDISAGRLLFYREAELKHGRVGMLATLGMFIGEKFHPLFGGNIDVPTYKLLPGNIEAQDTNLFWIGIILAVLDAEMRFVVKAGPNAPLNKLSEWRNEAPYEPDGSLPGDYGWDPLGLKPKDEKGLADLQNKELNNGRLAMLAAAGIVAQEAVTGTKVFQ